MSLAFFSICASSTTNFNLILLSATNDNIRKVIITSLQSKN